MNRRTFLKSGIAAASVLGFPTIIPRHVFASNGKPGANERFTNSDVANQFIRTPRRKGYEIPVSV